MFDFFSEVLCKGIIFNKKWSNIISQKQSIKIGFCYLISSFMLYQIMRLKLIKVIKKKNKYLKLVMFLYNVFQIILCSYIFFQLSFVLMAKKFDLKHDIELKAEYTCVLFYLTKILDFTDTYIIILKGKWRQLSLLHIFHHATMPFCVGNVLSCGWHYGICLWSFIINSLIHVLLYSHYFFVSLGFKNPLRKYLTILQLLQFIILFSRAFWVLFYINVLRMGAVQDLIYQAIMFSLFYNFYQKTFRKKKV